MLKALNNSSGWERHQEPQGSRRECHRQLHFLTRMLDSLGCPAISTAFQFPLLALLLGLSCPTEVTRKGVGALLTGDTSPMPSTLISSHTTSSLTCLLKHWAPTFHHLVNFSTPCPNCILRSGYHSELNLTNYPTQPTKLLAQDGSNTNFLLAQVHTWEVLLPSLASCIQSSGKLSWLCLERVPWRTHFSPSATVPQFRAYHLWSIAILQTYFVFFYT